MIRRRSSVAWRIIAAVAVSFIALIITVSVLTFILVTGSFRSVLAKEFGAKVRFMTEELAKKDTELAATGMYEDYASAFQNNLLQRFEQIYYGEKKADALSEYPIIVDANGDLLMHPDVRRGENTAGNNMEFLAFAGTKPNGSGVYESKGTRYWITFGTFEKWGWRVGFQIRESAMNKTGIDLVRRLVIIMLMVSILATAAAGLLVRNMLIPLGTMTKALGQVRDGDLTSAGDTLALNEKYLSMQDEIGELARTTRSMSGELSRIVEDIKGVAATVSAGSEQLSDSANTLSQGAAEQAAGVEQVSSSMNEMSSSIEEVSSSLEEMAATIRQNYDNARQTEKIAAKSADDARGGGGAPPT
ncbi:MAG: hypothetical protein AABZ39_09095, partial [Spirochaetota bacterium]